MSSSSAFSASFGFSIPAFFAGFVSSSALTSQTVRTLPVRWLPSEIS